MRGWALGDIPQADEVWLCLLEGLPQAPEDIRVVLGRGEVAGMDSQGVERIGQHGFPCGLRHPPPRRPEAAVLHRPLAGPMDQALEGGLSPGPLPQLPELRVGPALPPLFLGGPAVLGGGVGWVGVTGSVVIGLRGSRFPPALVVSALPPAGGGAPSCIVPYRGGGVGRGAQPPPRTLPYPPSGPSPAPPLVWGLGLRRRRVVPAVAPVGEGAAQSPGEPVVGVRIRDAEHRSTFQEGRPRRLPVGPRRPDH